MPRLLLFVSILASLVLAPRMAAQIPDSQLVFTFAAISFRSNVVLTQTEKDLLDSRFRSYFLEIARQEKYTLTSLRDGEALTKALMESPTSFQSYQATNKRLSSQGLLAMELARVGTTYRLIAGIYDPASGELLHSNQASYVSFSVLVDDARIQFYELFGLQAPISSASVRVSPFLGSTGAGALAQVQMADLVGTWKGDLDLGSIIIQADGSAIANLENDEQLRLLVKIERNTVVIKQDEPNSPKLYLSSFPLNLAGQISRLARPMQWDFQLSLRKDQLVGKKNTTKIFIENGAIVQVDNTYFRDAVWTRIP